METEQHGSVRHEQVNFPERFVGGEWRGDAEIGDEVVDGIFVGEGSVVVERGVADNNVAVDVDDGSPPVLAAAWVSDEEAAKSGVVGYDGVLNGGFEGVDVDGELDGDGGADDLVELRLQKEAAGGG